MENYFTFSKNHKWMDYQLTQFELSEANETCHENQIEIQRFYARIGLLEQHLKKQVLNFQTNLFDFLPSKQELIFLQHQLLIKHPQKVRLSDYFSSLPCNLMPLFSQSKRF